MQTHAMSEAEEILSRLESRSRSYRMAFCLAISGLAVLVVANRLVTVPNVIRAKSFEVLNGAKSVASISIVNHKVVFGTTDGKTSLVSVGQGVAETGVIVLSGATGKDIVRLTATKALGGSVSVYDSNDVEIANASPNVSNSGSLFIQASGTLIGEINGDKQNGGAILTHDAKGVETGRVHN